MANKLFNDNPEIPFTQTALLKSCVVIPALIAFLLCIPIWANEELFLAFDLSSHGYDVFIQKFKLPIIFIGAIPLLVTFAATQHRSLQQSHLIQIQNNQNNYNNHLSHRAEFVNCMKSQLNLIESSYSAKLNGYYSEIRLYSHLFPNSEKGELQVTSYEWQTKIQGFIKVLDHFAEKIIQEMQSQKAYPKDFVRYPVSGIGACTRCKRVDRGGIEMFGWYC